MTDADPIVKRTRCPHDDCGGEGTAVVPAGVEIVATATGNGETDVEFDGIVYGHCPDHEFYAYYVVADDAGGPEDSDETGAGDSADGTE